ncbi:hypothetical protein LTR15_001532 [Elasticomyces elasticus]|nr:hypothetical protein LTR15_001532 [Elasticomyces elasticus]
MFEVEAFEDEALEKDALDDQTTTPRAPFDSIMVSSSCIQAAEVLVAVPDAQTPLHLVAITGGDQADGFISVPEVYDIHHALTKPTLNIVTTTVTTIMHVLSLIKSKEALILETNWQTGLPKAICGRLTEMLTTIMTVISPTNSQMTLVLETGQHIAFPTVTCRRRRKP